jgi:hypothetical protein
MKLKLFSILMIVIFSSCRKNYSCVCDIKYPETPGGIWGPYPAANFSSEEPIEKKVTKKQADDICKKTEMALIETWGSNHTHQERTGGCVVK